MTTTHTDSLIESAIPTVAELATLFTEVDMDQARIFVNLLFYSFQRSMITLETEEKGLEAIQELTTQWHHCTERRLDPSKAPADYSPSPAQQAFAQLRRSFHRIHTRYAHIVQEATSTRISNRSLARHIETMRTHARSIVLAQMYTILDQLRTALSRLDPRKAVTRSALLPEDRAPVCIEKAIETIITNYGASSFLDIDGTLSKTGNFLRTQYEQSQYYHNLLWTTIEQARATFYHIYLMRTVQALRQLSFPPETFCSIVTPDGIADTIAEDTLLRTIVDDRSF